MEIYYEEKENVLIYVNKDRKYYIPVLGYMDKKDYNPSWRHVRRIAVRAIINVDDRNLMVYMDHDKYYAFPGGGVEGKETLEEALVREVKEETGYEIIPCTIKPFASVINVKSNEYFNNQKEIFDNISVYFKAEVFDKEHVPKLTPSGVGRGMRRLKVYAQQAYAHNESILAKARSPHLDFIRREDLVLKELIETNQSPRIVGHHCMDMPSRMF